MVTAFDRIVIAVPDLAAATGQYQDLTGCQPYLPLPESVDSGCAWFGLGNTIIELRQDGPASARVVGPIFQSAKAGGQASAVPNKLGLEIAVCDGSATAAGAVAHGDLRVDHLVLRTTDAQGCIALFSDQLGIRLALDRNVPEWGGRMLFFRAGKITLEVIAPAQDKPRRDSFWGIAYQCENIERTAENLARRGVELSEVRDGRKPGTRVATLRSHCLGIPTLLIEPTR